MLIGSAETMTPTARMLQHHDLVHNVASNRADGNGAYNDANKVNLIPQVSGTTRGAEDQTMTPPCSPTVATPMTTNHGGITLASWPLITYLDTKRTSSSHLILGMVRLADGPAQKVMLPLIGRLPLRSNFPLRGQPHLRSGHP